MSLLKRLWISIGALLVTVFAVTLTVFGLSGSASLEEQLAIETENTARTVALVLSAQELEPVMAEIQLSTLTNLSEFKAVELRDPQNNVVFAAQNATPTTRVPQWFQRLFKVSTAPASAPVQQGWDTWELQLTPFGGSAYTELWTATMRSAFALLVAFFTAGLIGQILLSKLLIPLDQVVAQAAAIGQRRFTKIAIPKTREFADVARSMNELSQRVQTMLSDEAQLLKDKKASSDLDEITGLLNRGTLIEQLNAKLSRENEEALGSVGLIRILGLTEMNREYGRAVIDNVLADVGKELNKLSSDGNYGSYCSIGRMNGADICAVVTSENNAKNLADSMQRHVKGVLTQHGIDATQSVAAACIDYEYGDSTSELLSALDSALAQSELQGGVPVIPAERHAKSGSVQSRQRFWQQHLATAFSEGRLSLSWFPVKRKDGTVLHLEGMARITIDDKEFNAGQFMPWVFRLGLGHEFDRNVVKCAIDSLKTKSERLHVNLSSDSLRGDSFATWLEQQLKQTDSAVLGRLGLEISESAVLTSTVGFEDLISRMAPYHIQVGIEHMGYRAEIIAELARLGPTYLKLDSLYTQDLTSNEGNRSVVSSFSAVAKSLGIECIGEGVNSAEDGEAAFLLGVSGISGRAVE